MTTISIKEVNNLSIDDILQQLTDNVKQAAKKNPSIKKILIQATNYIVSQSAQVA